MAEQKPRKKSLIQSAVDRVRTLFATADDRYVQWRRGSHIEHCKALLKEVQALPGGKQLLAEAKRHKVKIAVVRPRRIKGSSGRFSRAKGKPRVYVANNGDRARMATTLWHELRHVKQHIDRGDIQTGGVSRLFGTRRQHVISLMIEADAFTAQTMLALEQKEMGNPSYFDAFMSRESRAVIAIASFLKQTPYEKVADKNAFARMLFTEIMLDGLGGYNSKYMDSYYKIFKDRKKLEDFKKSLGKKKLAPEFNASAALTGMYGKEFAAENPVSKLATVFMRAQAPGVRATLGLIERTVQNADSLTQEEYAKARAEIMRRTRKFKKAFEKSTVRHDAERHKSLRVAARGQKPPPLRQAI